MALDIVILGVGETPEVTVALSLDAHAKLVEMSGRLPVPLLSRLIDYYADASYAVAELAQLEDELELLFRNASDDMFTASIQELIALVRLAKTEQRSVLAIAD